MTAVRTTAAATLTVTLGLAAACWVVSVWQMTGMDMGVATRLGSFAFFATLRVAMMAAMTLPGPARNPERELDRGTDVDGYFPEGTRRQHVRARGRHGLPLLLQLRPRYGVPDGLLRDP
jgi:hypothetical protein